MEEDYCGEEGDHVEAHCVGEEERVVDAGAAAPHYRVVVFLLLLHIQNGLVATLVFYYQMHDVDNEHNEQR